MKSSLMIWIVSVLILSVAIKCRNKTEEEKPKQEEDLLLNSQTNATTNTTPIEEEEKKEKKEGESELKSIETQEEATSPQGNIGKAKQNLNSLNQSNHTKTDGNDNVGSVIQSDERLQAPTSRAPASRSESPKGRTQTPHSRTDAPTGHLCV